MNKYKNFADSIRKVLYSNSKINLQERVTAHIFVTKPTQDTTSLEIRTFNGKRKITLDNSIRERLTVLSNSFIDELSSENIQSAEDFGIDWLDGFENESFWVGYYESEHSTEEGWSTNKGCSLVLDIELRPLSPLQKIRLLSHDKNSLLRT